MNEPRILIVFHTVDGQTAKIADRIADVLRRTGAAVEVHRARTAPSPAGYDAIVVGDPIRMTRHSRALTRYVRKHVHVLNAMPTALFQVSLISANSDEQHTADAQAMVQRFLDDTGLIPDITGLFAGALAYTKYGWLTRRVMRSIARREGGETDTSRDHEYTDWDAVERFAKDVYTRAGQR